MEDVSVKVKLLGVDEAIEKAEKLNSLIVEAKTLADELASSIGKLHVDVEV